MAKNADNNENFLPYGRQSIDQSDIDAVISALGADFLTTGPMVDRFEHELAQFCGAKEAVVVSNGTAALHIGVMSQNLCPDDVVIVPSVTFVASANAVAYCGARVVFCDVDPKSGLMSNESFDEAVRLIKQDHPKLRFAGVISVHLAGRPIDLSYISKVCAENDAFIIEDACHALGSMGAQGMVGSCLASNMACLSFHPVKTLTTGEGGAVLCNDAELAMRLRRLRSHGIERDSAHFMGRGEIEKTPSTAQKSWIYEMQSLGYNYRLPDINCALGVSQLKRLPHFIARRKALIERYQGLLEQTNLPVDWVTPHDCDPVFHLFSVQIDFEALGKSRADVMLGLKNKGIGSQVHYIPVHHQPYWQINQLVNRELNGADTYYKRTLSLPLYADMCDDDADRVMTALEDVLTS